MCGVECGVCVCMRTHRVIKCHKVFKEYYEY